MRIHITLPRWPNRRGLGRLRLLDQLGKVSYQCPCLGRSDDTRARAEGNPSRDPLRRFGDIPAGLYVARVEPRAMLPERTYGPHRPIRLIAKHGPAVIAVERNGRTGLLQHGGDLGPTGLLRPTHGCVRTANEDQARILEILDAAGITELPYEIVEIP